VNSSPALPAIQPYLFFEGRCAEAIEFYRTALHAEVQTLMRFRDGPGPAQYPPGQEDKIMYANLRIGGDTVLVADGRCEAPARFQGFALSLTVASVAEADQFFGALADGGQIQMPLAQTFFSPRFGMVVDRFGVSWMVYVVA